MQTPSIKIPIIRHTKNSFEELVFQNLGKGRQHAVIFYESWMRRMQVPHDHPAFKNAKDLLEKIMDLCDFSLPEIVKEESDGQTTKFLIRLNGGLEVESVSIPMQSGGTLCVSSQVGCKMGCSFCETGRMGLLKSLTTEEIVSQLYIARHVLKLSIRNVVFMGMGEPFDNYDEVIMAARVMMDPMGFGMGKKHLTISTSGLVDGIYRLMDEPFETPNLAVSITAATDHLRNRLMPVNRKHNLEELKAAMKAYNEKTGRSILAAYTLMKDVNDTPEHALELSSYLEGLNVKINLIAYNPQRRDRYQRPDEGAIDRFAAILREKGFYTLMRQTKGRSIMAACGQLKTARLQISNSDKQSRLQPN